ncbi:MAG: hypothetical protein QXN68_02825 [Thermoplasmata archaeon]
MVFKIAVRPTYDDTYARVYTIKSKSIDMSWVEEDLGKIVIALDRMPQRVEILVEIPLVKSYEVDRLLKGEDVYDTVKREGLSGALGSINVIDMEPEVFYLLGSGGSVQKIKKLFIKFYKKHNKKIIADFYFS